jgi:hypothetical protein
MGEDPSPR